MKKVIKTQINEKRSYSWTRRINNVKCPQYSKKSNTMPIKFPMAFFREIKKF